MVEPRDEFGGKKHDNETNILQLFKACCRGAYLGTDDLAERLKHGAQFLVGHLVAKVLDVDVCVLLCLVPEHLEALLARHEAANEPERI